MKMKKLLMTMAIIIAGCLFVGADKSEAARTEATVETNTVITDSLENAEDEKYYWFTVDKSGYFNIDFSVVNPLDDTVWGWDISLYDDQGYVVESWGACEKSLTTANLNWKKDTKLCLKVEAVSSYYAPVGVNYKFEITTVEDATWEQEYNDTLATATSLPAGTQKKGTLISGNDIDYYVYTMGKTGYFQVEFKKANALDDSVWGWNIKMYDVNGVELGSYEEKNSMQSQRYNFKKGTKVYFTVQAVSSYYAPRDIEYLILVKETAASNWEVETRQADNAVWSTRVRDTAALKNSMIYGSLIWGTDNDLFKLVVSKDGKVAVKFNTNNTSTNVGWGYRISIYDGKGKKLDDYADIKANSTVSFYAKKGTYYVEVEAESAYYAPSSYDAYSISATSYQAKTPSMKKKAITYKVKKSWLSTTRTLKWKKVSNVDGYEVQFCKNKKFKNKKTSKLTSDTNSINFTADKGKWFVRVRAYRTTISGDKIYGKFTKVKKIRVK